MRNRISLERLIRTASGLSDERAAVLWADYKQNGEEGTFNVLWLWIGNRIYPVLRGLLRCDQLTEDAIQAVMVQLITRHKMMPDYSAARAWPRRVATTTALQVHRSARRRETRERKAAKPESGLFLRRWERAVRGRARLVGAAK